MMTLISRVFSSLAVTNVEALHLVRNAVSWNQWFDSNIATKILSSPDKVSFFQVKKEILE